MNDAVLRSIERAANAQGPVLWLTGAGISAESGIPTFRGPEGYWRVGAREYRPMELATRAAFTRRPDDVWGWYLYRRATCHQARPNAAHLAIAEQEATLGERFLLVTQNVDGLHARAGNTLARTYQIHGNIDFMRCAADCCAELFALPPALDGEFPKGTLIGARERGLLVCPRCAAPARPHVLWFDESYDEARFRFASSLAAAERAALLVVVGTSGATNLPNQICATVARRGAPFIVIDPEPTVFAELAERSGGTFIQGTASSEVPALAESITTRFSAVRP
jgi:NAD-dependent deacetylase